MDPVLILESIARLPKDRIKLVAFTGGEPFLLGNALLDFVSEASSHGFITRVVTSAFFGTTQERANQRIEEIVRAGLNELSISWDDFHEEFVKVEFVRNVVRAAKLHGSLKLAVNVVQSAKSGWSAARVRNELGVGEADLVTESPLNLTGRAVEKLGETGLREERYLGPCPYIITGPTLSANGKLLACCGVIPDTERLCIEAQFTAERYDEALERAQESALYNWLYQRGPFAIIEWIGERFGLSTPPKEKFGGNCEACRFLFESKAFECKLDRALFERASAISGELLLLESLGMIEPAHVLHLWSKEVFSNRHSANGKWRTKGENLLSSC